MAPWCLHLQVAVSDYEQLLSDFEQAAAALKLAAELMFRLRRFRDRVFRDPCFTIE